MRSTCPGVDKGQKRWYTSVSPACGSISYADRSARIRNIRTQKEKAKEEAATDDCSTWIDHL